MEGHDRAAIGRFVLRTKEYLVALRVRDGLLSARRRCASPTRSATPRTSTCRRPPRQGLKEEVANAVALIEELGTDWDPKKYKDRHRDRLLKMIEQKHKGQTIKAPAEPEVPEAVPDLMKALEESLAEVRAGR